MNEEKKSETVCEAVKNEPSQTVEELMEENDHLLEECRDLLRRCSKLDDRFNEEHRKRIEERKTMQEACDSLSQDVEHWRTKARTAAELRNVEKLRKANSAPRLVIISFISLIFCCIPYLLQKACVIGPQLAYGIQTGLMMAIAWCYALIWDRTRK